jgi:hypothetical protein
MGEEFTPKDFRTWAGTLIAAVKLAELGVTEDLDRAEENVLAAVGDVAKRRGNTWDIARLVRQPAADRPLHKGLRDSLLWRAGRGDHRRRAGRPDRGGEEVPLKLLKKKLRRELKQAA